MQIIIKSKKFYPGQDAQLAVLDDNENVVKEAVDEVPAALNVHVDIVGTNDNWRTSTSFSLALPEDATDEQIAQEIRDLYESASPNMDVAMLSRSVN